MRTKNVFANRKATVEAFANGHESCRNGLGNIFAEGDTLYSYGKHFPLAIRLDNLCLINGDRYSKTTARHTIECISQLNPNVQIPFSGLKSAGIDPYLLKVIASTRDSYKKEEYKDPETGEMKTRDVHYLGQVLLNFKNKTYLSGFDSQESLEMRSYFLTRLAKSAKTVQEAIEGLKPDRIKQADSMNENYKRQGEWFFVERPGLLTKELTKVGRMVPIMPECSHIATEVREHGLGLRLVRGTVRHRPGKYRNPQHGMLKLGQVWHEVVKNTALESFQARGLVD